MSNRLVIAADAWGTVPDWLEKLIEACDAPGASQNKIAARIGRSPGVLSDVIRNRYKGNMADIEERVRAVFFLESVTCPALGPIGSDDCLRWRDEAAELKATPVMVRMYRACHACPRFTKGKDQTDGE